MRPCNEITDLISASLDNMLTEQEQTELDSHLAVCPACSALYAQLRDLHQACADLDELSAPNGFSARVMECIAADCTQEQPTNVIPFPAKKTVRSPWKRWGITAAAVAIVVLGAVSLPGQLNMSTKDAAAPEAMMACDVAEPESAVQDSINYYAKSEMAPLEPSAPAASAEVYPEAPAAAPVPMPSAAPKESLNANTTARNESFDSSPAPILLGTRTINAEDAPADLANYEVLTADDGTKTYTVPAEYFFTLDGSAQFKLASATGAEYGLVIVNP